LILNNVGTIRVPATFTHVTTWLAARLLRRLYPYSHQCRRHISLILQVFVKLPCTLLISLWFCTRLFVLHCLFTLYSLLFHTV